MPIKGARYRWKGNVRLTFVGNKVVEVKKKGGVAKRVKPKGRVRKVAARKRKKSKK